MTPRSSTEGQACRRPAGQGGYVLLPVVMLITLIAVLAFSLNHQGPMGGGTVTSYAEAERVEQVARAGLTHANWWANTDGCLGDQNMTTVPFGQGGADSYTAAITTPGGTATAHPNLTPDQDAWFRSDNVTTNNGTTTTYHLRMESGNLEYALVRFDLSSLPAGARINSATAWFYVKATKGHPEGSVTVHPVTADWTETGATWETMSSNFASTVLDTIPPQPDAGDNWVQVNLTAQVQAWVNGEPNFGIMLTPTGEGTHAEYISREGASGQQPRLDVVVGTGLASPATITATGTLNSGASRTLTANAVPVYQPWSTIFLQPDGAEGKDAFLTEFKPTWNYGNYDSLRIRRPGSDWHSPIQFDLAGVPHGARILSAALELYKLSSSYNEAGLVNVHAIKQSWVEGDSSACACPGVSFDDRDTGLPWNIPGGDFEPEPSASIQVDTSIDTWFSWDITQLVQEWADGTRTNHGMMLTPGDEVATAEFASSDYTDPAVRPKLTIRYACECGVPCLTPQGSGNVLMVIGNSPSSPAPGDQLTRDNLERWGYSVTFIQDDDSQGNFDAAVATADVAFVARSASDNKVGTKLTDASIGVVTEKAAMVDELGVAGGTDKPIGRDLDILDTSHYITRVFPAGAVPIYSADMYLRTATSPASASQALADHGGAGTLVVLDQGAPLDGEESGNAAGRRVMLPFTPSATFDPASVNHNGHLIMQRAIAWGMGADLVAAGPKLLFVTRNSAPSGEEQLRIDLIESWGYKVNLISDGDSQANFDAATADNDVAYVSGEVTASSLGTKLKDSPIGVVNEQITLHDEFGFSSGSNTNAFDKISVEDNAHYITSGFSTGWLTIATSSQSLQALQNTLAPGLQTLATTWISGANYKDGLALLDTGAELYGGGTAAGRRVQLPWGGSGFDFSALNGDGQTIMQRAIEWCAGLATSATGPLAHWKLDETSGTTAVDSIGGHDGTLANGPAWTDGQLNGGLDFVGSDDTVDAGSDAAIDDVFAGGGTLTAWIKPRSWGGGNFGRIADKADALGTNRNGWAFEVYGSPRALLFQHGFSTTIGNWYTPTDSIVLNTWQHAAVVYDNSADTNDPVIYINGVAQTLTELDTPSGTPSSDAASNFTIGNYAIDLSRAFDGVLDDVRLYGRMLSPGEIADLATPPPKLPIAHWKLDETSGSTAVDSEGGHDGTLTNGPTWDSGTIDGGLLFDGSNDYVVVPHNDTLSLSAFSISAWIQPTALSGWQVVVNKGTTTSAVNYYLATNGDEIGLGFYNASWVEFNTTSANLSPDQWYHVVATFDDTTGEGKIYLDGSLVHTGTTTTSPLPNSDGLTIGRSGFGEYWPGTLDDVRIYDSVLTETEVAELAVGGGGGGGGGGGSGCDGTYRDEFNATDFAGSDGTIDWSTDPWTEVGESDGETSGDIRITNDTSNYQLRTRDNQNGGEGVEREADLSGATTATLSYEYRREGLDNSNDYTAVEVSANGAAGPWTELTRHQGGGSDSSYVPISHDISSFISANTGIRFKTSSNMGNNDTVWFDNIQIECRP